VLIQKKISGIMNFTKPFYKKTFGLIIVLFCLGINMSFAQDDEIIKDKLYAKRGFFNTKIYRNGIILPADKILTLYYNEAVYSAQKKYVVSRYLLPAGPVFVAGGFYLGYDAIKGTPMQINIDGKVVDYTVRPIGQLIGGLAVFAIGVCLIEYSNEFKATSVNIYNKKFDVNKIPRRASVNFGLTPSNGLGFVAKF
jgi:hypothetical protein